MLPTLAACLLAITSAQSPKGFLSQPKSKTGPGVLVLHPWWGLNQDVKNFCRRLSKEGFIAYAPDLFHGKVADTIPGAEDLTKKFKHDQVAKEVVAAATYLNTLARQPKKGIAVVGFSFGGFYALELSNTQPILIRSVVVFYGTGHDDFTQSKAAYLGHFAAKDEFEPAAAVQGLKKALDGAKRPNTLHTYPETGHWFFEPSRKDAYNKPASDLAWKRTLAFLRKPVR